MPTPLPAKKPGSSNRSVSTPDGGAALASRTSAKLEPPDPGAPDTLEPGTIIAERYRVDSLLGEGGMGKVYAAEHIHMRKQVAIKVLHPEMSTTPEVVARFEREAVAAGKITHPNVAAATDFGRLEDRSFFLVLEYVAGVDLRAALRQGPMLPDRALKIIRQITAAVGAAHSAGVVHRDLKPENIMLVDRDGEPDFVKVLDFGIAKIDAIGLSDSGANHAMTDPSPAAQPLTKMGAVFGTPDYMSPEQALGQSIDARSDLYSLGIMFHELLTGERPFKGGAVTLMRKHVLEEPPPLPPALTESAGPRFDEVIQRLLKKSAADRFASASELLQALAELAGEAPSLSSPTILSGAGDIPGSPSSQRRGPDAPGTVVVVSSRMTSPDGALAKTQGDPIEIKPPQKKRYGLTFLVAVALGGGALYWLGLSPSALLRDVLAGRAPTPAPLPSAVSTSSAPTVESAPVTPSADVAAAVPVDSAPLTDIDEEVATPPDDSAATAASAPHHGLPRVTQGRPSTKPIHKANKSSPPAPKHGGLYVPPPSQWFKN